jgi:hypothetical protein
LVNGLAGVHPSIVKSSRAGAASHREEVVMTTDQKGVIAGLALGSFVSMVLILFGLITMPGLVTVAVPLAALGVFLGVFSGSLVTMTWWSGEAMTSRFFVSELA